MNTPTITIITVVKNGKQTLPFAIESVIEQNYSQLQHIIMDGASSDGTQQIIEQYAERYPHISFTSKPDKGMYYALNEGIERASGDIIGFLHADDFLYSPDVLKTVASEMGTADGIYGDLVYVSPKNIEKVRRFWQSCPYKAGAFRKGWHPPHPALYLKRAVYERFGGFDTSLRLGNDVEFMMRLFERHHIEARYIPKTLVGMRLGGISNRSFSNIYQQNKSIMEAFAKNNLRVSWPYFIFHKGANRLKQFIKQPKEVKPCQSEY